MSGAIPVLLLYAFMAWTGTTLPFTFYYGGHIVDRETGPGYRRQSLDGDKR